MLGNNIQPKSFLNTKKQLKVSANKFEYDTNLMPTQNDDMLLEEAYDNVISYLENNQFIYSYFCIRCTLFLIVIKI